MIPLDVLPAPPLQISVRVQGSSQQAAPGGDYMLEWPCCWFPWTTFSTQVNTLRPHSDQIRRCCENTSPPVYFSEGSVFRLQTTGAAKKNLHLSAVKKLKQNQLVRNLTWNHVALIAPKTINMASRAVILLSITCDCDYFGRYCDCNMIHNYEECLFCTKFSNFLWKHFLKSCQNKHVF